MVDITKSMIDSYVTEVRDKVVQEVGKLIREAQDKDVTPKDTSEKSVVESIRKEIEDGLAVVKDRNFNKSWKKSYREGQIDAHEDILYMLSGF